MRGCYLRAFAAEGRMAVEQRQEPFVAIRPAHGWHWQADIQSVLRCWLKRPLSEAQPTIDRLDGALLERLLPHRANSPCRPKVAHRYFDSSAKKRPHAHGAPPCGWYRRIRVPTVSAMICRSRPATQEAAPAPIRSLLYRSTARTPRRKGTGELLEPHKSTIRSYVLAAHSCPTSVRRDSIRCTTYNQRTINARLLHQDGASHSPRIVAHS